MLKFSQKCLFCTKKNLKPKIDYDSLHRSICEYKKIVITKTLFEIGQAILNYVKHNCL